jgi:hypothetical protein
MIQAMNDKQNSSNLDLTAPEEPIDVIEPEQANETNFIQIEDIVGPNINSSDDAPKGAADVASLILD